MPYCAQCGTAVIDTAKFCQSCGKPVGAHSRSIGQQIGESIDQAAVATKELIATHEPKVRDAIARVAQHGKAAASAATAATTSSTDPAAPGADFKATLLKWVANGPTFVMLYIGFMIPTYLLPYGGSNSIFNSSMQTSGAPNAGHFKFLFFLHLASLVALCVIASFRGKYVGKQWLVVPPIIATIFDFIPVLNWVPFVPTAMHLFTVIKGASASPLVNTTTPPAGVQPPAS